MSWRLLRSLPKRSKTSASLLPTSGPLDQEAFSVQVLVARLVQSLAVLWGVQSCQSQVLRHCQPLLRVSVHTINRLVLSGTHFHRTTLTLSWHNNQSTRHFATH